MKLFVKQDISSLFTSAFLNQSVDEADLLKFVAEFNRLYQRINAKEREVNQKNIVSEFLQDTFYKPHYEVNSKGDIDLVIHNGKSGVNDTVGVIIEAKRIQNKAEMITATNPNVKALHETLLYYLDERIRSKNSEVKHLMIFNINDWYIIDAKDFEKIITPALERSYKNFRAKTLVSSNTEIFYNEIATNFFNGVSTDLPCVKVNIHAIKKLIDAGDSDSLEELTNYYKLLSPQYLLKLHYNNDSNKLNKEFYNELLYILGLKEIADGQKILISRFPEAERNQGSLIENTINILKTRSKLNNIPDVSQFGTDEPEQLFSVALELCITWLNRILFLKLLEGQLIKYNDGNKLKYTFLTPEKIKDFDELDELFFEVLAIPTNDREPEVTEKYGDVPYLNSSLFEPTELEQRVLEINGIKDRYELPLYQYTVLKDGMKRKAGRQLTLKYLFDFLNAHDFASDNKSKIQKERKTIINAAVLGLIFEKINGYKDGSFFTPGYVTEYICRETLRNAVREKFNSVKKWNCETWNDLKRQVDKIAVKEANQLINEIKICDPAVGSGHFLVSALNQMLSIKHDLQVFSDASYATFRNLNIKTENDELVVNLDGELYNYNKKISESQKIQETLFNEKRIIIENCLFGVDINPKSAMICQLRLWIELLKSAYYTKKSNYEELETLPNIDINIKVGNSLISRFNVHDADKILPKDKERVEKLTEELKSIVSQYKDATDKSQKDGFRKQMKSLKKEFETFSLPSDKDYFILQKKKGELSQATLSFDSEEGERLKKMEDEVIRLENLYNLKQRLLYSNSLEWRFEFPEIVDSKGMFEGFDVIIGNPPYIYNRDLGSVERDFYQEKYGLADDLYSYFFSESLNITKEDGFVSMITPNTYLTLSTKEKFRIDLLKHDQLRLTNSGYVFEDAYVETEIFKLKKMKGSEKGASVVEFVQNPDDFVDYSVLAGEKSPYETNFLKRFFVPTPLNLTIYSKWSKPSTELYVNFREKLLGKKIKDKSSIKTYVKSLKPGSLTLLGLISDGEQGLVTGNNSRYIASIIDDPLLKGKLVGQFTSLLNNLGSTNYSPDDISGDPETFYDLAEKIKLKRKKPAVFGKFFTYKIAKSSEVKSYSVLTNEEQVAGTEGRTYIYYQRGNDEGFKWYVPLKESIIWDKEYVKELRDGVLTNSRWQGENYYQTSGFGWVDYFTEKLKAFYVEEGPYSKNIVKFHSTILNDKFIVALLNSTFITYFIKNFITATHTLQINDGRLIPIVIPDPKVEKQIVKLVDKIIEMRRENINAKIDELERQIDDLIYQLYAISPEERLMIEDSVY